MTESPDPLRLLDGLDEEQRLVAESLRGPVCVLAGAGTGKTRAITHRIAYGVASGTYAANRVMALTFTTKAAAELRQRLRFLGAGTVAARTFHSAALSQLNYFWPGTVGGSVPSLVESKARVLGQAAEKLRIKVDTATLRDLAAEVEWRKVSGLSVEQYARAGRPPIAALSAEQVAELQVSYETIKDERRQIDFEDVLLLCAGMIQSEPSVAMRVREQYRFFVVDEYQDVSPLQHRLLELWVGDRRELCVVGDASQTIYSFAGARSDYLLGFGARHPGATIVRLERNYRSEPPIVDTANRLMRGRAGSLTLHPVRVTENPEPEMTRYASDIAEARGVAEKIRAAIDRGMRPENIAVLYRVNVQGAVLETALSELDVSYQLRGGKRFFDLPEVKQALMALRGASVSAPDGPLFKSVSDVLSSLGWSHTPPEVRGSVRDRWDSLNAIIGLVDTARPGTTLREFTDELLERQAGQHEPTVSAVTLATLHSAKGLEWESVHLVGVSEGLVPISYARGFESIDEERRLLYVGITRARSQLSLSWAQTGARSSHERQASRFLAEIGTRSSDGVGAAPAGRSPRLG